MNGRRRETAACLAAALTLAVMGADESRAVTRMAPAIPGAAQAAIDAASAGDTVCLAGGQHAGPLALPRAIVLRGESGAVVDGGGRGTVIEVAASGAILEDLEVRGTGKRVLTVDSGIKVKAASGVILRSLRVRDALYGVYVERSPSLTVEDCRLEGRVAPLNETGEGNGIHLWYSDDAAVRRCDVSRFADAIYLSFAHRTRIERVHSHENGRYGLHTMYCRESRLVENVFTRNVAGIAIMFSDRLRVERNTMVRNRGPRTYGLLLRDCSGGWFEDNRLIDNTIAIFMDNSNRNRFARNRIEDNGWGVLLFASCAGNEFVGNDFVHDDFPVALDMRRTSNRFDDGTHGNYWSDNPAYDLDGDGVSDVPHSPVTAFAFVSKQYPDLSVLAKSPAVAALGVAERVFPALRPSDAVDGFPSVGPHGVRMATLPAAERRGPGWAALSAFTSLAALGLTGLLGGRAR